MIWAGHGELYEIWARYALRDLPGVIVKATAIALLLALFFAEPLRWAPLPDWVDRDDLGQMAFVAAIVPLALLREVEKRVGGRWAGRTRALADGGKVWMRGIRTRFADGFAALALLGSAAFLSANVAWAAENGDGWRALLSAALGTASLAGGVAAVFAARRDDACLRIDADGLEAPGRLKGRVLWTDVRRLYKGEQGVELVFQNDATRRAALVNPDADRPRRPDVIGMNWPVADNAENRAVSWIIPFDEAGVNSDQGLALILALRPELKEARRPALLPLVSAEPEPA